MIDKSRIRSLNEQKYVEGAVLYWMGRDQRVKDNWGLLAAQAIASKQNVPMVVAFTLDANYSDLTIRQSNFLLRGLAEVERDLGTYDIPFYLLTDSPEQAIIDAVSEWGIGCIVTDFMPLRTIQDLKSKLAEVVKIPLYEVDAHNVVPSWVASQKQEVGARTLRPKLHRFWPSYLTEFPQIIQQTMSWFEQPKTVDWAQVEASITVDRTVPEIGWTLPGEVAAECAMRQFIEERLNGYSTRRNLPGEFGLSELSPYLHFGQLSAQRLALTVNASGAPEADKEAYIEELLVRRELSDNYCLHNLRYDSLAGAPGWAQISLAKHSVDRREFIYSRQQLEQAKTHDPLWNAAQQEMLKRGKMHGYMRMYWAKKILEWTLDPSEALTNARYLNDRYFVDGRDPNGYVGLLWAIGGLHDRPWFEREIFGQVRYMNFNGAKRKFDVDKYIAYVEALAVGG